MADIQELKQADENALNEIQELLRQFGDGATSREQLHRVVDDANAELWTVIEDGKIIGMATLVTLVRVRGTTARVEDVVVDEAHRGKGLGKMLIQKLIERAKERGAYSLHLTSRPDRVAANGLYQKLGFQKRETNAYRLQL